MTTTTTLPFAGAEMCNFEPLDSAAAESTVSGTFDPTWARCSLAVNGPNSGAQSPKWTDEADFWHHEWLLVYSNNQWDGEVTTIEWRTNAGTTVAKMTTTYNGQTATIYKFYTLQSGVLTLVDTLVLTPGLNVFDIRIKAGSSGAMEVYVAGTQRVSHSLNHSGFAGVGQVVERGSYSLSGTYNAFHSEIICDNENHIGDRVKTQPPTGAGANTAWTGAYTDVDEAVYSDADKITSTAANDVETFVSSATVTGIVKSVHVGARANCGATGPQNMELALRASSTNYFSASRGLAAGLQAVAAPWKTDPSTSSAWVTADALAAEFGVKALA